MGTFDNNSIVNFNNYQIGIKVMIIQAVKEDLATTNTYIDFYMEPSPLSSKQGFQQVLFLYLNIFENSFLFYIKD